MAESLSREANEERVRLEELEKQLECMKHGESGGRISFGDLVSGVGDVCVSKWKQRRIQLEQASRIKQLQQQLKTAESELERVMGEIERNHVESARSSAELERCRERVNKLRSEVSGVGFDGAEYEHVQESLRVCIDVCVNRRGWSENSKRLGMLGTRQRVR